MRGGGEEEGPTPSNIQRKKEEYEVHVVAEDKPPPPPYLLRLNIKPLINTSCSSLRCSVNKYCLSSLKVLQEHVVSMCPFFFLSVLTSMC